MSDKVKTWTIFFMAMACVGMAFDLKITRRVEPMRVKQFEDKIDVTPEMIWFRGFFARVCATEGKRVDTSARLMKLCHAAYNMANTGSLEADPEPENLSSSEARREAREVKDAVITGVTAGYGKTEATEDKE